MAHQNILVTGGAGFIGSHIAIALKNRRPSIRVTALDNLRRRGSELNLPRLRAAAVEFRHCDIRDPHELFALKEPYDLLIECSAEPSALAGYNGDARLVVNTNLFGTVNCLELARDCRADFLFMSTSRVYPTARLNALAVAETDTRFVLSGEDGVCGASAAGIAETFSLAGARTLYGATKLASELLIEEYRSMYGLKAIVNRCGVVAGPWQMGKIDQGVFTLWIAAHHFNKSLKYIGFGGTGKQVRDLVHVADLVDLVEAQLGQFGNLDGRVFNVGGGLASSLSLQEATILCERVVGRSISIGCDPETRPGDVRIYVTDNSAVTETGWKPRRNPEMIFADIHRWIVEQEKSLISVMR